MSVKSILRHFRKKISADLRTKIRSGADLTPSELELVTANYQGLTGEEAWHFSSKYGDQIEQQTSSLIEAWEWDFYITENLINHKWNSEKARNYYENLASDVASRSDKFEDFIDECHFPFAELSFIDFEASTDRRKAYSILLPIWDKAVAEEEARQAYEKTYPW